MIKPRIVPYFCPTHSINQLVKAKDKMLKAPQAVKIGGRIIGKRKAGKKLMFLDLESGGTQMQVKVLANELTQLSG